MAAIDNVLAYVPKLLYEYINHASGHIVTAEEFNERWNLNVAQGDYTATTLRDLISVVFEGTYLYDQMEEWAGTNLDQNINAWAAANLAALIAQWADANLTEIMLTELLQVINTWFNDNATLADLQQIVADWVVANNVIVGNERVFDLMAEYLLANPQTDENALHVGEYYNGVMINTEYGMVVIRDDQKARVQLNSSVFIMQVGDGVGNYTNALYFDPINGEFVFDGKLTAQTIEAVTANINTIIADYIQANNIIVGDDHITSLITQYLIDNPQSDPNALVAGNYYHGVSIDSEYGLIIVRNDELARVQLSSSVFIMQVGDGLGNYTNALYFDPVGKKYIFDGELSANVISAIEAQIDVVMSQTVIVQQLYAQMGDVADLKVNRLETSNKVERYLNSDTSRMDFIRIEGESWNFIEGTVKLDGVTPLTEQLKNPLNQNMYWTDETHVAMTLEVTAYPVMVYQYNEVDKLKMWYELETETGYYIPRMVWGAGAGVPGYPERGKGYMEKDADGFKLSYINEAGTEYSITLGETGILMGGYESLSKLDFYTNGFKATYGGHVLGYRWTKDGTGKITQLENIVTSDVVAVAWGGGTL